MVLPLFIGYNLINPLIHKPNVASIMFMVVAGDAETRDLYPPGILNQLYDKIDCTSTQYKSKARLLFNEPYRLPGDIILLKHKALQFVFLFCFPYNLVLFLWSEDGLKAAHREHPSIQAYEVCHSSHMKAILGFKS